MHVWMSCSTPSNGEQSRDRVVLLCIPTHPSTSAIIYQHFLCGKPMGEAKRELPKGLACLLDEGHWVRSAVWCGEGVGACGR
jgi:hypothetical protein